MPDPTAFSLTFPTIELGGVRVAVTDRASSARIMVQAALARRASGDVPLYSTSANGEVLSRCSREPDLGALFAQADLVHADGMPMVWASRWLCRERLPERVATTDLFHDCALEAVWAKASFYMLGATPASLAAALATCRRLYPGLRIVGAEHGHFDPADEDRIVAAINEARPDILWISMGVPREQAFAVRHRARLTGVGLIKTSGGLFDFLSGTRSRAPRWMQVAGLEWLYRLALEPRRLFWRYALTNPHALFLLATRSA